jgi:hypothetical protein
MVTSYLSLSLSITHLKYELTSIRKSVVRDAKSGIDVFGNNAAQTQEKFKCHHCGSHFPHSRYTQHLEKCLGLSRRAPRKSNRPSASNNNSNNSNNNSSNSNNFDRASSSSPFIESDTDEYVEKKTSKPKLGPSPLSFRYLRYFTYNCYIRKKEK